jgi:hypothetical protein
MLAAFTAALPLISATPRAALPLIFATSSALLPLISASCQITRS